MQLKVKKRLDIVQYAMDAMGQVAEDIRGQSTVGSVQVLLRLSDGEITPQDLADILREDEDEIAESLEIFEEFGIVDIVDPDIPSYQYNGYPEEIKFLLANKAAVKKKFEDAITHIEEMISQQTAQTETEKKDLDILSSMTAQMRKDYDI
ncbi:MAG: hypothetical protein HXS46_07645 [Theionarchaea archaeon]|nr:MAG: hypothetical protein AYK18_12325 [Theionarchaea archaeon DG-70]MBU7010549.1 hypothetical protein [Theionarchaea archaeon]